jgi:hypothetical protein
MGVSWLMITAALVVLGIVFVFFFWRGGEK